MKYVIDTNALRTFFRYYYRLVTPELYANLDKMIENGDLISVKEVYNEMERQHQKDSEILQELKNIHFHISGNKLIPSLTKQIFKIIKLCKNLQTLDIGGGYEDLEVDDMIKFLSCIHNRLKHNQIIIVECGDMWFKNAGKLYTYVLSVKDIKKNTKIIYLPISKEGNLKWSSPVFISKNSNNNQYKIKYYFYGATCYEKDLIGFGSSNYVLQENDLLEFGKISPYSAEWNTSFNGIDKIEVVYE